MAYKVIILYRLYMPSYFLGTFTEYPCYRFLNSVICGAFLTHSLISYLLVIYIFIAFFRHAD